MADFQEVGSVAAIDAKPALRYPPLQHAPATPAIMVVTMPLTGPQYQQLQDALLHAFDELSLKRMVRFGLGEDLPAIAGGANFSDTVFELIGWAERSGRTAELVAAAAVPHNPELQAFVTQNPTLAQPAQADAPALPAVPPATAPAARKAWLIVEGMEFFAALPGAQVRVTANVNGTEH